MKDMIVNINVMRMLSSAVFVIQKTGSMIYFHVNRATITPDPTLQNCSTRLADLLCAIYTSKFIGVALGLRYNRR